MTTDAHEVDPAMAERLARLQARRTSTESTAPTAEIARDVDAPVQPTPRRSRRPKATTSKVVTVGATATATLGLIALYGAAEQRASSAGADEPVLLPATETPPPAVPVQAAATTTPPTPQVVVVVLDGRSASELPAELAADPAVAAAIEDATAGQEGRIATTVAPQPSPAPTTAAPATTVAAPIPVATPKVVDLAVPVPPRPAPAPSPSSGGGSSAPAAAPAPAPAPQATSSGS